MTKNEFQRLRNFLKQLRTTQIRFSNVYIYIHCAEADAAPQLDRFQIRKRLGKLNHSLDFSSLRVDLEADELTARRSYANNKVEQREVLRFKRGDIKKIDLSVSYYANGASDGKYITERF